jgi:hypothetical protein
VVDHGEVPGLLSMRDIVRCWSGGADDAADESVSAAARAD